MAQQGFIKPLSSNLSIVDKVAEAFHGSTSTTPAMRQIGNPLAQTGTFRLQNGSDDLGEALQVSLVFGLDPLTQRVLQLTIQKGGFHEFCCELGNFSVS
jgi:hypothetical protein